ncbi:unnamed protein product [Peronospora destructor]|uniref:Syntaxin N-terminal domain-containing protein n=1 Tax=Peronospora destructor TaxID=86335 RepID=A0AAV0TUC4_9STRA|nr:unnamed protein product [Peronospora destructor]
MTLFGTPQDSRANHQQLTDRGNKLVAKINRRLQDSDKGAKDAGGRARKTQVAKLSMDYKNQLKSFEETYDNDMPGGFGGYNEDQIYAQANVTHYNEDDLARQKEDILKISQQLYEVNAAYQEVDGLVQPRRDLDIEEDTNTAQENTQGALHNVREANRKRGLRKCSKTKLFCLGIFSILVAVAIIAILATVQ